MTNDRLRLFSEFELMLEQDMQPWYVAARIDPRTTKALKQLVKDFAIPNPCRSSKYHCTLIHSRKPTLEPKLQQHQTYAAHFDKFDVFDTRGGERCLVLKLNSLDLQRRHKQLMTDMQASYDFPQYLPHITLSYDIGDFDISKLAWNFKGIYLEQEYSQLLNDLAD